MYCEECDVFYDDGIDVCGRCAEKSLWISIDPIMNEEDAAELDMLKTEDDAAGETSESALLRKKL